MLSRFGSSRKCATRTTSCACLSPSVRSDPPCWGAGKCARRGPKAYKLDILSWTRSLGRALLEALSRTRSPGRTLLDELVKSSVIRLHAETSCAVQSVDFAASPASLHARVARLDFWRDARVEHGVNLHLIALGGGAP